MVKIYLQWSQSVKIVICGRGKFEYLTGEAKAPVATDPVYNIWFAENSIVHTWLINSMEPRISCRYLFLKTAKDVWDTAQWMYSDLGNVSQVLEIQSKLKEMKQGTQSVTQYFTDLEDKWQELDLLLDKHSVCETCSVKQRQNLEKEQVYDFLVGLNRDRDEVWGRVLSRVPFPTIDEAFAEVRREVNHQKFMLSEGLSSAPLIEGSALMTRNNSQPGKNSNDSRTSCWGERMWCDHCSRHWHTKDTCWKIHGKPTNWVPWRQTEGRGFQAQSNQDKQGIDSSTQHQSTNSSIPFSKEQLEQFYRLLNPSPAPSLSTPDLRSCSIAQSGNHSALTSLVHSKEP